jgi:hypothetical protein
MAWFICEGSYWNKITTFALSEDETENIDSLLDALEEVTGKRFKVNPGTGKGVKIDVNDCELGEFLIKHCGSGAWNKKIPLEMFSSREDLLYEILIKGDGCNASTKAKRERDQYVTVSRTLAYQVQLLAHMLGYRSGVSKKIRKDGYINGRFVLGGKEVYEIRVFKFNPFPNTKRHKISKIRKHKYNVSAKVKKIILREDYEGKVYNMKVDVDNSYTANGVVVHNCEFLASGRQVFDPHLITRVKKGILDVGQVITLEDGTSHVVKELEGGLRQYRPPEEGHMYVMGGDVAEGVIGGDYSVAVIYDRKTGEEVAFYRGHVPPELFGKKLDEWGRLYNDALAVVEVNNHGLTTVVAMKNSLYPNLYFRPAKFDTMGTKWGDRLGWKTTMVTRPLMIDDFNQALREESVTIHSREIVDEMLTFIFDNANRMAAMQGFHDDTIFASSIGFQGFKIMYDGPLDQMNYSDHLPNSTPY